MARRHWWFGSLGGLVVAGCGLAGLSLTPTAQAQIATVRVAIPDTVAVFDGDLLILTGNVSGDGLFQSTCSENAGFSGVYDRRRIVAIDTAHPPAATVITNGIVLTDEPPGTRLGNLVLVAHCPEPGGGYNMYDGVVQ